MLLNITGTLVYTLWNQFTLGFTLFKMSNAKFKTNQIESKCLNLCYCTAPEPFMQINLLIDQFETNSSLNKVKLMTRYTDEGVEEGTACQLVKSLHLKLLATSKPPPTPTPEIEAGI